MIFVLLQIKMFVWPLDSLLMVIAFVDIVPINFSLTHFPVFRELFDSRLLDILNGAKLILFSSHDIQCILLMIRSVVLDGVYHGSLLLPQQHELISLDTYGWTTLHQALAHLEADTAGPFLQTPERRKYI